LKDSAQKEKDPYPIVFTQRSRLVQQWPVAVVALIHLYAFQKAPYRSGRR
jgi:hypothetical protein